MRTPQSERPQSKRLPQILTEEQILKLFRLANWFKHALQLKLMYYCGLRVSEMLNLRVEDIDLKDAVLKVVQGKFGKDRLVPIPKPLKRDLTHYFLDHKEGKLFDTGTRNIQRIMDRLGKKLGVKIHPHMLRHSYATHVLENTNNLELVRDLLGHSNIQSTTIYTHLTMKSKLKSINELWK